MNQQQPQTRPELENFSTLRVCAAWAVHAFTALGLPLMFYAALELIQSAAPKDPSRYFLLTWLAVFVDAIDGFFARKVKVKQVLPGFNGARLDNLIDFMNFAFLPGLALVVFDLLPEGFEFLAVLPILASGYGFCQETAKTEEAFVGLPSYWNSVLVYLCVLQTKPWLNALILGFLAVMVFVPIHYLYPSRTSFLRALTIGLAVPWAFAVLVISQDPRASWAPLTAQISLIYPAYYTLASLLHHRRLHGEKPR